ncbi:MAG: ParA family protein [Ancrocorticia sp.]
MLVTAIANQKGGVGKTSLAVELAYQLSIEQRCLLVDLDPQASASNILGIDQEPEAHTVFDLLGDAPRRAQILHTIRQAGPAWGNLSCLPAERALADVEQDSGIGREMKLKQILEEIRDDYEVVIIDCPPSLGVLTANALVAADQVLIVSEPRIESAQAIGEILATIANVKAYYNSGLQVAGIVINRFLRGRRDQARWVDQVREIYQGMVLEVIIPDREAIARAASDSVPAATIASNSELEQCLRDLAHAITRKDRS